MIYFIIALIVFAILAFLLGRFESKVTAYADPSVSLVMAGVVSSVWIIALPTALLGFAMWKIYTLGRTLDRG